MVRREAKVSSRILGAYKCMKSPGINNKAAAAFPSSTASSGFHVAKANANAAEERFSGPILLWEGILPSPGTISPFLQVHGGDSVVCFRTTSYVFSSCTISYIPGPSSSSILNIRLLVLL